MADFILEYDILESIANNSKSLGKRSKEYSEKLESKIITGIDRVAGPSSGYLTSASDSVRDKINALKLKSDAFYHFADQITNLLEVAEQIDQEVADAIAAQREYFLDHHEALRIDDWKAKLLGLIVDIKNSIPLLDTIADILDGLNAVFEALEDSIKHWYECEGGKYIVRAVGSVVVAAVSVALFVAAFPVSGFFAVCGAIGAGIAAINGITNVATSFRAADAAIDGDPAWAVIYGKQDKLSDVLRQTNFGSGGWNALSNLGAGALDTTETICDVVGFAEIGKNAIKLFKGDAFKFLKNKGSMNLSDLKNGSKSDIVDLKNNIQKSYTNLSDEMLALKKAEKINASQVGEEMITYRRVQGGMPPNASRTRILVDENGNIKIPNKTANLNISTGNAEHANYFLNKRGSNAEIVEFEVPKWFDEFLKEYAIPQKGYKSSPFSQGGTVPKVVDPTTPGTSYELPAPWIQWLEEYAVNGKRLKGKS